MNCIPVNSIVEGTAVVGRYHGGMLRRKVSAALEHEREVSIDFAGVQIMSQSAADEFIGRIVRYSEDTLPRIKFCNCTDEVKWMIQWAADNAHSVEEHQRAHEMASA